jgi:flagellar biosynthesis protein FlhG
MNDQAENLRRAVSKQGWTRAAGPNSDPSDRRRAAKSTRVIAVASGEKGAGKTVLTVNIALALIELNYRVLIIDADNGPANVEELFGTIAGTSLRDAICGGGSPRGAICEGPRGVRFMSGGAGIEELASFGDARTAMFIAELSELDDEYDIIVVDAGGGASGSAPPMAAAADEVVVVSTAATESLTDAYALIKTVAFAGRADAIGVVANKAKNAAEAFDTMARLEAASSKFLDVTLRKLGYILYDPLAISTVGRQMPLFAGVTRGQVSERVREIALRLAERAPRTLSGSGRGLSGYLRNILGCVKIQQEQRDR